MDSTLAMLLVLVGSTVACSGDETAAPDATPPADATADTGSSGDVGPADDASLDAPTDAPASDSGAADAATDAPLDAPLADGGDAGPGDVGPGDAGPGDGAVSDADAGTIDAAADSSTLPDGSGADAGADTGGACPTNIVPAAPRGCARGTGGACLGCGFEPMCRACIATVDSDPPRCEACYVQNLVSCFNSTGGCQARWNCLAACMNARCGGRLFDLACRDIECLAQRNDYWFCTDAILSSDCWLNWTLQCSL